MDLSDFSLDELCAGGGGGGGGNELSRLTTPNGGGGEMRLYSEAMNIPQVKMEMMEDDLDFDTNFYEQLLDAKVLDFEAEPVVTQTPFAPSLNQWGFPSNIKIEDIFQVEQCDLNLSPTLAELNASSDPPTIVDPLNNLDSIMNFSLDDPLCSPSPSKPSPIAAASSPLTSTTDISGTHSVKNSGSFLTEQSVSTMDWSFDSTPMKQEFKPNLYLSSLSSSCPASSSLFVSSQAWRVPSPLVKKEPSSSSLDTQPSFPFASEIEDRKPLVQPSLSTPPDTSILSSSAPVGCGMLINRPTFRQRNNSTTDKSLGSLSSLSISNDEGFDSHGEESNPDDDLSSDGESFFPEEGLTEENAVALLFDYGSSTGSAPGKKKKRYFWQYNTQSKGPKGSRLTAALGTESIEDPHTFPNVSDPVFSADCHAAGVKHAGKARRGDGNDLTPNPRKLFNIGLELRKLNKVINELAPTPADLDSRPAVTRKEKNKLASRACRLKKKAQHEANKLKLHGLQEEHKLLLTALSQVKSLLVHKIKSSSEGVQPQDSKHEVSLPLLLKEIEELPPVAGQTTEFVNEVLQKVAKGDPTGGLHHRFHHHHQQQQQQPPPPQQTDC